MLGRTDSRGRLILLLCVLGLVAGALGLRLAYWQIGQGDRLRNLAADQAAQPAETQVRRGDIVDTHGTVLATTAYRDRLAAYPDLLSGKDSPLVAQRLGDILGLDGAQRDQLVATLASDLPYTIVSKRLTIDQ